jgi:hypothetical protein
MPESQSLEPSRRDLIFESSEDAAQHDAGASSLRARRPLGAALPIDDMLFVAIPALAVLIHALLVRRAHRRAIVRLGLAFVFGDELASRRVDQGEDQGYETNDPDARIRESSS